MGALQDVDAGELRVWLAGTMTALQAADRLGCGRTMIFALLKEGKLKRARSLGRKTLISVESIERLSVSLVAPIYKKSGGPISTGKLQAWMKDNL